MTKIEYLNQIDKQIVDEKKVEKVQTRYGTKLPEIVQKIISGCGDSLFLEDGNRILSFEEIVDAENDLHVDFKGKGIIPLVDCKENDFIVYHFRIDEWSKFNIVEEIVFRKRSKVEDLL